MIRWSEDTRIGDVLPNKLNNNNNKGRDDDHRSVCLREKAEKKEKKKKKKRVGMTVTSLLPMVLAEPQSDATYFLCNLFVLPVCFCLFVCFAFLALLSSIKMRDVKICNQQTNQTHTHTTTTTTTELTLCADMISQRHSRCCILDMIAANDRPVPHFVVVGGGWGMECVGPHVSADTCDAMEGRRRGDLQ
eukprot:gene8129-5664_t